MSLSTIPHNDRRVQYAASAGQVEFWFDFPLARALDLSVTRQRGGRLDALSQQRDYHVTSLSSTGGTIRLSAGAQAGDVLELFGERKIERTTNFSQRGDFSSRAINDELNHIYMILQELKEEHGDMLHLPESAADLPSAQGLHILAQDAQGNTVRLDANSFIGPQGIRGERGKTGLAGPRGSVPSVIAESQSGCVVGNIDGGFFGENYPCQDAAVFSLKNIPQDGVLGWHNHDFKVLGVDEFKGERGETGLTGPRGVVPSVIAEADNGAYIGNIDGGFFGQAGGNISGNIFSLEARPGVMGFDADGKAKLFGYNEFKGQPGEPGLPGIAGPVGPIGPRGSVPSVIAESQNGAMVGNIDGGFFGENASAQAALFSSVRADSISYSSTTVQAALDALEAGKLGRSDPVDGGEFGESRYLELEPWILAQATETITDITDIDGGIF